MPLIFFIVWLLISNFSYAEDLETITAEQYLAQNPSPERKAILDYTLNQFDGLSVSQKDLDQLWNDNNARDALNLARFQIIDQKLYASSIDETYPHFRSYIEYFQKLINKYKIQDVDFMIHMYDSLTEEDSGIENIKKAENIPIFMMSKDLNDQHEAYKLILPEPFMLWNTYPELLNKIDQANNKYLWGDKISKLYWRGSTSSDVPYLYSLQNFAKLPRLSLVILSKLYPNIIDARFTNYMGGSFDYDKNGSLQKILELLDATNFERVSETAHLKYKYLISIDGNTCAWRRVPWIMYSNSVLVKQETAKIEWFYPAIKPYIHYVPVNENLTDIFSQFDWIKAHDNEVQQISRNARNFVANELMPENIDAQMVLILNKYHDIIKNKKLVPSIATFEETRSFWGISKAVIIKIKRIFINWIQRLTL